PDVGSTSWASQEAKKGSAASSGAVGAGAGSRLKLEAPLAKGPGASPQGSPEDQPAGWRARLKPVEKSPVDRAPEAKEPQVLREPRAGDAAGKASGSSKAGIRITLTSVRVDRTPGAAGPGASLPGTASRGPHPPLQAAPRRLMAKPEGLKSPQDRRREQDLLDQYVHTVNSRSDIIDFLDEDRLREQEEDEVLQSMIQKLDLQRSGEEQRKKPRFRLSSIWSPKSRSRTPE
ncbi:PREDICTED: MICAL-like protein 2, partial [Bison bison bison]|uniref:MICAL-like protein 2 n=1 Tax=Bison bison bison TaxID=43346 RepID=A0A6P3HAH8_BISBB